VGRVTDQFLGILEQHRRLDWQGISSLARERLSDKCGHRRVPVASVLVRLRRRRRRGFSLSRNLRDRFWGLITRTRGGGWAGLVWFMCMYVCIYV
jgi:hypothetical protein